MWSASRRALATLLCAGACLTAAACGFEPVYGDNRGGETRAELQGVRVALIPNRAGQVLRRHILDRIHAGDDDNAPALYQLEINLAETRQFYGIQRDQTATYARATVTGYYVLRDIKAQKIVTSGTASAYSSYNIAADPFNSIVAENDARERAVHSLGDDVIARIALYLRNPTPPPTAATTP